ncbi:MAG: RecQ family zinc-binding domain-containing protein, partial [Muribaculaceae bacterium]|nr:RecQ family zinc-binding domain-containing protein [Muribaculaceae bacterium]
EELYHIGASHEADLTLQCLLRQYPGLFSDYVRINEAKISREIGLDQETVYNSLLELNRQKILVYVPRRRTPCMFISTSREESRYVSIGRRIYEDRFDVMSRRIEAMIDYAFNDDGCRVDRMLSYFGEDRSCDCGKCDICRSRKKSSSVHVVSKEEMIRKVWKYMQLFPSGITQTILESNFTPDDRLAGEALRYLVDEGFAVEDHAIYRLAEYDSN